MNNNEVMTAGEVSTTPESTLDPIISEAFIKTMKDASVNKYGTLVIGEAEALKKAIYDPVDMLARKLSESMVAIKNNILTALINTIYPVGYIMHTADNKDPKDTLGVGKWVRIAHGRVLVGIADGSEGTEIDKVFEENDTGGKKTHTLSVDEMPSHSHSYKHSHSPVASNYGVIASGGKIFESAPNLPVSTVGGNKPHNNLQPYMTCYIWKRTA